MKKFKRFLKNNLWVLVAIADIAIALLFFYMLFGFALETAAFHAAMNIYAG